MGNLIDEGAALETGDLAAPHVRTFKIGVQQQVAREGDVFAGIVDADVEVQLLLAQDQPVGQAEPAHCSH